MEQLSKLLLQVYIDKVEFKTTIENLIQNRLVGQEPLQVNGFDLEIKEFEHFNLALKDRKIAYDFIIKIKLNSNKISGIGGLAKVKLKMETSFDVSEQWILTTKTYLKDHEWIEKPVMKVKILSIPSTGILELLIAAFDDKMCGEIDKLVQKGSDLKSAIDLVIEKLMNPIPIKKLPDFHLDLNPENIKLYLDDYSEQYLRLKFFSQAKLSASVKKNAPQRVIKSIPPLHYEDVEPTSSLLVVDAEITYHALSQLLKEELKEVDVKGKKINFDNFEITSEGSRIAVEIDVSGDLEGKAFCHFIPNFDESKQLLKLDDLKFKLESKQLFAKTTSWMFRKLIERKLAENAAMDLSQILNNLKFTSNKQLERLELYPGFELTGDLDSILLKGFEHLPEGLKVQIEIVADFSAQIRMQKSLTQT